ncbi:MAG: DUF4410 domain-containing protein [Rhodospirillaceae bacterium]|nr:MAG: DUF4410 domain-containing protein [Rhodospirillaceae bacterium]
MFRIPVALVMALVLAGCASTDADITKSNGANMRLPFPSKILVYDFAISPSEVSPESAAAGQLNGAQDASKESAEQERLEREVASIVADDVARRLRDLGLPATRWHGAPPAGTNLYAIEGQFVTIDEGSAFKRMIIGFGSGGTEVRALVQAYYISNGQKTVVGEAEVSAESSKKPGLAATLPISAALSAPAAAFGIQTGIGVVSEINTDVQKGAEETAEAIVELLKPRMEAQGWIHG